MNYPFLTLKERDIETGLDYFEARYYSNTQGRFTSIDPESVGADPRTPQSWNAYSYGLNNPLKYTDPSGLGAVCRINGQLASCDEVIKNIRTGNFETTTVTHNGSSIKNLTVLRISFNQSGFLAAAQRLAGLAATALAQINTNERQSFGTGFGGGRDFGGAGAGGSWPECPAFTDSPYHPENVRGRQQENIRSGRFEPSDTDRAKQLGFNRRIPAQSAPFDSHGQEVFTDGRRYISRDVDAHKGGVWKMFDRQGRRVGTFNDNLEKIGP